MILGLGIDLVEIERIANALVKYPDNFVNYILTKQEQNYCRQFKDPAPEIAARFAAKEALSKALGTGITNGIRWHDIEVIKDPEKPPRISLKGQAGEKALEMGINNIRLSLTHTKHYAAAVVTAEKV